MHYCNVCCHVVELFVFEWNRYRKSDMVCGNSCVWYLSGILFPINWPPDTDNTFEMGIVIHDGDTKDFFKSIKTLSKVQDLHEEFLILQKTLQAFIVGGILVGVCMYVCMYYLYCIVSKSISTAPMLSMWLCTGNLGWGSSVDPVKKMHHLSFIALEEEPWNSQINRVQITHFLKRKLRKAWTILIHYPQSTSSLFYDRQKDLERVPYVLWLGSKPHKITWYSNITLDTKKHTHSPPPLERVQGPHKNAKSLNKILQKDVQTRTIINVTDIWWSTTCIFQQYHVVPYIVLYWTEGRNLEMKSIHHFLK
jgi:hypothetical protein